AVGLDRDDPLFGELKRHGAAVGKVPAGFFENAADFRGRPGAVIGEPFDHQGDPSGGVGLVRYGFIILRTQLAGALLDRLVDRVLGHVDALGLVDDVAQRKVVPGVAAVLGGDDDLAGDLAPDLPPHGVV